MLSPNVKTTWPRTLTHFRLSMGTGSWISSALSSEADAVGDLSPERAAVLPSRRFRAPRTGCCLAGGWRQRPPSLCSSLSTHLTAMAMCTPCLPFPTQAKDCSGHFFPHLSPLIFLFLAPVQLPDRLSGKAWMYVAQSALPQDEGSQVGPMEHSLCTAAWCSLQLGLRAHGYVLAQGSCKLQYLDVSLDCVRWGKCKKKKHLQMKWVYWENLTHKDLVLRGQIKCGGHLQLDRYGRAWGGVPQRKWQATLSLTKANFQFQGKSWLDRCTSFHAFLCFNVFICEIQCHRST